MIPVPISTECNPFRPTPEESGAFIFKAFLALILLLVWGASDVYEPRIKIT